MFIRIRKSQNKTFEIKERVYVRVCIPKVPMRLVAGNRLSGEFQCTFAGANTGNHLSARSVALHDDDVSRFLEDAFGFVRHGSEFAAGDPVAPDSERAELPGRVQHQIGGDKSQRPEVDLRRRRREVRSRQRQLRDLQRLLEKLAEDLVRGGPRASPGRNRRRQRRRNLAVASRERHCYDNDVVSKKLRSTRELDESESPMRIAMVTMSFQ